MFRSRFSAEDFKNKYVFEGRNHDPSQKTTYFDQHYAGRFTQILGKQTDDASAITKADELMEREFEVAKPKHILFATLRFNGRIVKNYPQQSKLC